MLRGVCAPFPPGRWYRGATAAQPLGRAGHRGRPARTGAGLSRKDPPWKSPCPWAAGSKRADPAVGGCGARAPQPCLGLLGPQEPSPRRCMGSGVSAQVGSVHQGERDREKPPGPRAGLRGWSLLGSKVPPSEFLEHSPPDPKLSKKDPNTSRGGWQRAAHPLSGLCPRASGTAWGCPVQSLP